MGDGLHAEGDDFDGARGVGVTVGLRVEAMKTRDGVWGPVDAEFEALAVIAEIGRAGQYWTHALGGESGAALGFEIAKYLCDLR